MKIGVISDVHCHVAALETALDLMAGEVDEVLVAGDVVYEYRFSNEVVGRLRRRGFPCIQGNHEMVLLGPGGVRARSAPGVDADALEWMATWPYRLDMELGGRAVTVVHSTPWPPFNDYLTENDPAWLRCRDLEAELLIAGHTHVPMTRTVEGTLIVNPGSLGESRELGARDQASFAVVDLDRMEAGIVRFPNPG